MGPLGQGVSAAGGGAAAGLGRGPQVGAVLVGQGGRSQGVEHQEQPPTVTDPLPALGVQQGASTVADSSVAGSVAGTSARTV